MRLRLLFHDEISARPGLQYPFTEIRPWAALMVATSLQASRARNASNSLIIVAGLGTTGTTAIEVALVRLGLSTAKWNHVVRPAGWTPGVSKPKCSSPTRAFHAMHRLLRQGIGLHTRVQSFRLYDDVDAVLDSPAIDYLPFLLQAYPRSRLILTTRDSAEWARRRAREHKCTPAPFQLWFGAPEDNRSNLYLGPCRPTPRHVLEHSFNAWNRSPAQCHATAHCTPYACLPVCLLAATCDGLPQHTIYLFWNSTSLPISRTASSGSNLSPLCCQRTRGRGTSTFSCSHLGAWSRDSTTVGMERCKSDVRARGLIGHGYRRLSRRRDAE